MYIEGHPVSMIGFVDWLSFKKGERFVFCLLLSLVSLLGRIVYIMRTFVCLILGIFSIFSFIEKIAT